MSHAQPSTDLYARKLIVRQDNKAAATDELLRHKVHFQPARKWDAQLPGKEYRRRDFVPEIRRRPTNLDDLGCGRGWLQRCPVGDFRVGGGAAPKCLRRAPERRGGVGWFRVAGQCDWSGSSWQGTQQLQ